MIGVAIGVGAGWLLGKMAFSAPSRSFRLADSREPVLALAMTLGVYGLAEVLHGYGFIAVFVAALTLRVQSAVTTSMRSCTGSLSSSSTS